MNKKLKSKDEKKNTYRRSFDDKFPGVLGLLKDEKKVEGWERVMKSKAKKNWEAELQDIFNTLELKERESDDFSIAYMGTYSLIRQLLADSKIEWQEEQNRVVNSGRKLYQEGQKTERERIIGEVEKLDEIATITPKNTPTQYDVGDFHLIQKDDILHILKGDHD